jgi:TonB family protein
MMSGIFNRKVVLWMALAVPLGLVSFTAGANEGCSVLTSEARFPYSQSALAARNAFLAAICGGLNCDIYLPWDVRIRDRFERASQGYSSHDQLYPEKAKKQGLVGKVVVAAVVEADGSIQHTVVMESSGHAVLDEAAAVWIKKSGSGSPARLDGQPVRIMLYVPIEFKLTAVPKK